MEPVPALTLLRATAVCSGVLSSRGLFGLLISRIGVPLFLTVENFERCIPGGVYRIDFEDSPRFGPDCLTVFDVPGRTGIRFHAANWGYQLEGCIAPGLQFSRSTSPGVLNSRLALQRLHGFVHSLPLSDRFLRITSFSSG